LLRGFCNSSLFLSAAGFIFLSSSNRELARIWKALCWTNKFVEGQALHNYKHMVAAPRCDTSRAR
jgi:hypothetical protein